MIKQGQIYKEKNPPQWRKHEGSIFAIIKDVNPTGRMCGIIYKNGTAEDVGERWINADCELVAEYPTWQEAVSSNEFNCE